MKKRIFITLLILSLLINLPISALASRDINLDGTTVEEGITIDGTALPNTWVSLKVTDKDKDIVYFSGVKTGEDSKYSFTIDLIGNSLPLDVTISYEDKIETFQVNGKEETPGDDDPKYIDVKEGEPVKFNNGVEVEGLPAGSRIAAEETIVKEVEGIESAGESIKFTFKGTMPSGGVILRIPTNNREAGLSYYNKERQKWELQEGSKVVEQNGKLFVEGKVHHLSIYGPIIKSAQLVADSITSIKTPSRGEKTLILPNVPDGFTVEISESNNLKVIDRNGRINPSERGIMVRLKLKVTKESDNTEAYTEIINVPVPGLGSGNQGGSPGGGTGSHNKKDIYLTVYEENRRVKEFTLDELEAIAKREGNKSYNYSAYNSYGTWKEVRGAKGPTIKGILSKAGIRVTDSLGIIAESSDGYESSLSSEQISGTRYYYPNGNQSSESNKVAVPAILALNKENGRIIMGQAHTDEVTYNLFIKNMEGGQITVTGDSEKIEEIQDSKKIKSVESLEDIMVKVGTPVGLLDLPKKVEVTLNNGEKEKLEVKWDTSGYNGQVSGQYKIEGDLILSKGITNKDKIKAYINIVVLDNNDSSIVTFTDINNHWAKSYIEFMASNKFIEGKGNKVFDPEGKITRAEFATILARMSGDELKSVENKFHDVKLGDWFASYITWAVNKGITKGVSHTEFAPNSNITREQMAVMILRYADSLGIKLNMTQQPVVFNDGNMISDYAIDAVEKMQRAGLIEGRPGNIFDPKGNATRAEACKMLGILVKSKIQ